MAIFTLAEARALLPRVQEITQQYHDLIAQLQQPHAEAIGARNLGAVDITSEDEVI